MGFTLIETIVVVTLVALIVSTVTLKLDGFTTQGRIRSAAARIAAVHRLACTEALCSGVPRRMAFTRREPYIDIQEPARIGGRWRWSQGRRFVMDAPVIGLTVDGVGDGDNQDWSVRIRTDGASNDYACALRVGQTRATVTVDGWTGQYEMLIGGQASSLATPVSP